MVAVVLVVELCWVESGAQQLGSESYPCHSILSLSKSNYPIPLAFRISNDVLCSNLTDVVISLHIQRGRGANGNVDD
jgi:hypothetical protein